MKAVVTMRFYGYMDTNTITNNRKKDEIIKNFIENKYVNRKLKKKRLGAIPCHECMCSKQTMGHRIGNKTDHNSKQEITSIEWPCVALTCNFPRYVRLANLPFLSRSTNFSISSSSYWLKNRSSIISSTSA